jgi:hypothetical protein
MTWCSPICAFAYDLQGRPILSALTKRTYEVRDHGRLTLAEQPLPLDTTDEPLPRGYDPSWRGEIDAAPYKPATDVVVFGRAHAPGGSCRSMDVEVELPELSRTIRLRVTGDRYCTYRVHAPPIVSPPEAFETMPMGYDRAYGGVDHGVDFPAPPADVAQALAMLMTAPGAYPRNPAGVGFVTRNSPETVDGLRLPNVERADQPLRPEQIVCPGMQMWHRQPMPAAWGGSTLDGSPVVSSAARCRCSRRPPTWPRSLWACSPPISCADSSRPRRGPASIHGCSTAPRLGWSCRTYEATSRS